MQHVSPSTLICTDLAIGFQTGFDLSVDMRPISEAVDRRRTWNGAFKNLADPAFRLYAVRISSGEGEIRAPALSRLWPGFEFQLIPPSELDDQIATGGTAMTLQRMPYVESIRVIDLKFNSIPFTVSGKIVTLAAPAATPVRIYYRPILDLVVSDVWTKNTRASRAEVSWELPCEEVGGLS